MEFTDDIDATGLLCPLPVLRLAKRLRALAPGQVLRIATDDPVAVIDVPHFCTTSGDLLLDHQTDATTHYFTIQKS